MPDFPEYVGATPKSLEGWDNKNFKTSNMKISKDGFDYIIGEYPINDQIPKFKYAMYAMKEDEVVNHHIHKTDHHCGSCLPIIATNDPDLIVEGVPMIGGYENIFDEPSEQITDTVEATANNEVVFKPKIHDWFELSYAQYLTIPRSALQSMPGIWQEVFTSHLEELDEAIDWRPKSGCYWVKLRDENGRYVSDPLQDYQRGRRVIPFIDGYEQSPDKSALLDEAVLHIESLKDRFEKLLSSTPVRDADEVIKGAELFLTKYNAK